MVSCVNHSIVSMADRSKWKSTGEFCSAIGCNNNRRDCPQLSFFRFPTQEERYVSVKVIFKTDEGFNMHDKDIEFQYF